VAGATAAGLHVVHVDPAESMSGRGQDDVRGVADLPRESQPDRLCRVNVVDCTNLERGQWSDA